MQAEGSNSVAESDRLGQRLIVAQKLSQRDLDRALIAQKEMGGRLGEVLVRLGLVAETDVVAILCDQLNVPFVRKEDYPEEPIEIDGFPLDYLHNHRVVPIDETDAAFVFASLVPQDEYLKKALRLGTGKEIRLHLATAADIDAALERYREEDEAVGGDLETAWEFGGEEFVEHLKDLASEAPVIQRVNQIIQASLDVGASDIHLEFFEDGLRLRYRIDGVLQAPSLITDESFCAALISRIKLLANLNIAERRLPQDGRIMMRVKGHELDLRVSTLPTVHGEGVVMRVLDRQSIRLELTEMGFSDDIYSQYESLLKRPHGVVLLTGPTGSGKTTTLYASLSNMDSEQSKIITVEDPVEYQLHGINQIPVHTQIGLTFARALRSILRQDPDTIMIGEMRDSETAQIAVQAALTGHLVLSTLHTNTAAGAVTRLEDMGVERFLITAAVNGVLSQRLIRRLCDACKVPAEVPETFIREAAQHGLAIPDSPKIFEAGGCEDCKHTGFRGRLAIHELFVLDAAAQKAVLDGADAHSLREHARSKGMVTLYEDGLRKVIQGLSSMDEVLRVTQDQTDEASDAA